jgi:orotate phosphoribosyltransferase
VQEVKEEFGIDVYSIVTVSDIIAAIENGVVDGKAYLPQMLAYREQYGVK